MSTASGTASGTASTTASNSVPDSAADSAADATAESARRPGRSPAQERGRLRREALLAAAVELLHEGGFVAVTHRSVARRARLPLAATTYYFTSREELVAEAFALLVDGELAALREAAGGPDPLGALLGAVEADRPRQLGLWELYLQAGRDPALQRVARAWTDGCDEILTGALQSAGYGLAPADVRLVTVLLNGWWLERLVEQRPRSTREGHALLARVLSIAGSGEPETAEGQARS
ncbi:TetR/AcrR family transcriptional regulator [Streptosporangium sp. CA-135522]|uniref:TetR/AcrR family transcriptional regulator n=1 Tax=Streptosporangium sp. CA-135522 TaxID=3240072 RepID=UPI003D90FAA4